MDIIIGFSTTDQLFSKLTQAVEKRPFSHTFVQFVEPVSQKLMIFQAAHGMVHLLCADRFKSANHVVEQYAVTIQDLQYRKLWQFMLNQLGTPYSAMQLVKIGIKKLFNVELGGDNAQAEICSELVARVCEFLDINVPSNLDYVTPSDLQKIVSVHAKRIM